VNTRTTNFLELVGNGRTYRVPPYQRDYLWSEEQWEDLWTDIVALRGRPDERHYMGSMVVEAKSDREFLIIDGQQRIATLSLLALAVIARLGQLAAEGHEPEANRERALGLRHRFVGEKDPSSLVEQSKLFLNQTDGGFYQDYLVQIREPLNYRRLPKSNRLLWDCYEYFRKRVAALDAASASGVSVAEILTETVGRQLIFILITVEDDLNAYTVFETLNARGLELSATDLLKNYLFSRVNVQADLDALARQWRTLILTVGQERFPEFLRYHLQCDVPKIRSQRLFKLVRERVASGKDAFDILRALEGRAELYCALSDPTHAYWVEHPECNPYIRELNLFRVGQMTPLLFAAWERLARGDFSRVLKLVSVLSFRYTVVSGLNPNALEPVYHNAAKAVLDRRAATPGDVARALRDVMVNDARFQSDFAQLEIDTSGQRKKLAKYMLARLEGEASQRNCDPDNDPGTIEHILPENPSEDWADMIPRDRWEASVYRLGNLTLLESSKNKEAGSGPYAAKCTVYEKSAYALTRTIAERYPDEWTLERLADRQQAMAERAVHLWRFDF